MAKSANTSAVFIKAEGQDRFIPLDLSALLEVGRLPVTVTVKSLSPSTTTNPLSLIVQGVSASVADIAITGGLEGTSYGVVLTIVDDAAQSYEFTVAVTVRTELALTFQDANPYAFQSLMDTLEIGGAAIGKAFFILPATASVAQGYVTWSILDKTGIVYATGNAYDFVSTQTSSAVAVEAHAVVNVPSAIDPSSSENTYQLRWELNLNGQVNQYAFENIKIAEQFTIPIGAQDTVELMGDLAFLDIVLDRPWEQVSVSVYTSVNNQLVVPDMPITKSTRVSSGWHYQVAFDTNQVSASLDPYIVSWKFKNAAGPSYRDTGQMFVVNASILRAVKSITGMIAKAKTTLLGFKDELFPVPVIVSMLGRGRDTFNGAGGYFTTFTMTNADAMIRELWLKYTEVALLQAQYLLEGEKAYNFSGQAISLEVDRTQFYQGLANDLKTAADQEAKAVKQNLLIKGITGGDGSLVKNTPGFASGPVGISLSAASQYPMRNFFRSQ